MGGPAFSTRRGPVIAAAVAALLASSALMPAARAASAPDDGIAQTAAGTYLSGLIAEATGDLPAASAFLAQSLASDPNNPELLERALAVDLTAGRMDAAATLARRLNTLNPNAELAQTVLVTDEIAAGHPAAALLHVATMSDQAFGAYLKPLLAAWTDLANGRVDASLKALAPLQKMQGLQALYALHAALLLDVAGRPKDAAPHYQAALHDEPTPLRTVALAANFDLRHGRRAEARALLAKAGANAPDGVLLDGIAAQAAAGKVPQPLVATARQGMAEALFDIASALQRQDTADIALPYARLALVLRPDLNLGHLLIADIMDNRGDPQAALDSLKQIKGDPDLGWIARLREASVLAELNLQDQAAALLTRMAAERPKRVDALAELGDLQRAAKHDKAAIAAYDQAIARLGKVDPRHWSLLYARALAYDKEKNWPKTEADLKHAVALAPNQPYLLNYLGYSWVDRGIHLAEAEKMIRHAVELRPTDGFIVDSLGAVRYKLGDYAGAVQILEKAVTLEPNDPVINEHLGDAYWQAGRRIEARFEWQRALGETKDAAQAATLKGKLADGLAPVAEARRPAPAKP